MSMYMAEAEVESDVEVNMAPTNKQQRKLPAKLRDSVFLAKKASAGLDLEAEIRDSKSWIINVRCEILFALIFNATEVTLGYRVIPHS